MEFNLGAILATIILNGGFCLQMWTTQQMDICRGKVQPHNTLVPETRQRFLHWQDFACQLYGNTIGLTLIQIGFFTLAIGNMTIKHLLILIAIAIASGMVFGFKCLAQDHKPDWGYPTTGNISTGGMIHCVYFGLNIAMVAYCAWGWVITGNLRGPVMWITIAGGVIYSMTFSMDYLRGYFDPIRYEE